MLTYNKMRKRDYHKYLYLWNEDRSDFDRLLIELSGRVRLPRGRLKEISSETGLSERILRDWRTKLQDNPEWKPIYGRPGPHALTQEHEEAVLTALQDDYLSVQRLCPSTVVANGLTREGKRLHGPEFSAGPKLVRGFLERHGLSLRKPHLKRRSDPDDESISAFLTRMDLVFAQFPRSLVINADETCWRLINGSLRTVARVGADAVHVVSKTTTKTDITVIAACTAAGERLPLWILTKGKGPRCEDKYRDSQQLARIIDRRLFVDHSTTGWSTAEVMLRYLKWLKSYKKDRMLHIVWDLYASHREPRVVDAAATRDIGMTFIPAGQTGEWQPLDRRVFGSLKQRAVKILNERMIEDSLENCNIIDAIAILTQAWDQVTEEEIIKAWEPLFPQSMPPEQE